MIYNLLSISDLAANRIVLFGIGGVVIAFVIVMILQNRKLKKISEAYERRNQFVHSEPFALNSYLILNTDNKIININRRAQKMFGWKLEELRDSGMEKILVPEDVKRFEDFKKTRSTHPDEDMTIELQGVAKDGTSLHLEALLGRWIDGVDWYYTVVIHNISHRKRNEETIRQGHYELNKLRELYHEGEKIGSVCFWKLDVLTGIIDPASPNFSRIFGVNGTQFKVEMLIKRIIAEDRIKVATIMSNARDHKTGYEMEYRMNGWDGDINTIQSCASAYKNKEGQLIYYIGMARIVKTEKAKWL
jgi:PAS domain S-box-containing protein